MSDVPAAESTLLSWVSVPIELHAPAPCLRFLERYLSPWFSFGSAGQPVSDDLVRVTVTDQDWEQSSPGASEVVALHAGLTGRRFWIADAEVVINPEYECAYLVEPGRLTLAYRNPDRAGFDVLQVLRSLLLEIELARGARLVHAAALSVHGVGTLLTGEKGAGKTSSILSLLSHPAVRFVSNDKVLLGGELAHGLPMAISAEPGLRGSFGDRVAHTSRRMADGKELFFPCEFITPPVVVPCVRQSLVLEVSARRRNRLTWQFPEDPDALADRMATFSHAVHGTWVRACLPTTSAVQARFSPVPAPTARLTFDPWRADHVEQVVDGIVALPPLERV